jgi:DNA polymerase-3 subunit alpha
MNFTKENNNIRYGLSAIKGISDSAMQKILDFRGEYDSKIDCFLSAKEAGLNIGVLSSLIQAGALDGLDIKRTRLVLEAQTFNLLTDREKKLIKDIHDSTENKDILLIIKKLSEQGKIKESRFNTIKNKYESYKKIYLLNSRNEDLTNYFYEKNCLGFSYSQNLTTLFKEKNKSFRTLKNIVESAEENERVLIIGEITDQVRVSRSRNNNKFLRCEVTDDTYKISALLFDGRNELIEECKKDNDGVLPEKNSIVIVSGRYKGDAIFADKIVKQDCKIYRNMRDLK